VVPATPIFAPSLESPTRARIFDQLAAAVLGIVAIIALLTFRDYGLSWDDYAHSEYGDLLLQFYASG
jgi:hypothetical protein